MKRVIDIVQIALLSLMAGLIVKALFNLSLSLFLVALGVLAVYVILKFSLKRRESLSTNTYTLITGLAIGILIAINV